MAEGNHTAIIIGHGPGIGGAVADAFADEGYSLALVARDQTRLDAAAAALRARGADAIGIAADASDPAMLIPAIERAAAAHGRPEVLIYNAARWRPGPVLATAPESLEADLRLGIGGALAAARAIAPAMIAAGHGSLLFTGGGLALHPSVEAPSLSIAKAGIRALALMLAQELAPHGVRVGTVTIMGTVAPNTPFAPEKIAKAFLALHASPPDPQTAEFVFRGE